MCVCVLICVGYTEKYVCVRVCVLNGASTDNNYVKRKVKKVVDGGECVLLNQLFWVGGWLESSICVVIDIMKFLFIPRVLVQLGAKCTESW